MYVYHVHDITDPGQKPSLTIQYILRPVVIIFKKNYEPGTYQPFPFDPKNYESKDITRKKKNKICQNFTKW